MPDSALKPCPFCGGEAEFASYKRDGLVLRCKTFGCVKREQRTLRKSIEWLREGMTEDWNRRALPAPAAAEPGLPQPFGYVSDGFPDGLHFQHQPWPEMQLLVNSTAPVFSFDQLRAYGQAMAEHARMEFAERAIDLVAFHGGPVDLEAAIRAIPARSQQAALGAGEASPSEESKDAARYRWLRQHRVDSYLACGEGEDLDAAIDAILAAAPPQGEPK